MPMDDDRFDELLLEIDRELASGKVDVETPPVDDPELARRLSEASSCLQLLEATFPRHPAWKVNCVANDSGSDSLYKNPITIGRFVVIRELGRGGHGVVFLAFDPTLNREVAVKVPRPECLPSAEIRMRFRREATAAARLDHPNLIPLYEAAEVGPVCYLVSAYCPGPTLAAWLKSHELPIAHRDAARFIADIANAVDYIHHEGILHRDIKPANVILQFPTSIQHGVSKDEKDHRPLGAAVPRVTDFGLAWVDENATLLTRTGAVLGTPSYMAPEQADSKRASIGPATDIYSLGVLLYELITRRPPFLGIWRTSFSNVSKNGHLSVIKAPRTYLTIF
jgi:serine/threonine protein kinase